MKTIAELLAAREQKLQAAKTLRDAAGANMTEEQAKQVDALLAEAEDFKTQADKLKADADRIARLDAALADVPASPIPAGAGHHVQIEDKKSDPMFGFKAPADFLLAVVKHGRNEGRGLKVDQRLAPLMAVVGSDEQSGANDAYGGFLVPETLAPGLLSIPAELDPMAAMTQKVPMASPIVKINARVDKNHSKSVSGGLIVYRREQAESVTAKRMEAEQIQLNAHSLMGLSYATEEILVDSPVSFAALLEAGFRDEFTAKLHDERLNGSGVGQFLGILNSAALVTVAKEAGQAEDTVVFNNVLKMRARAWGYANAIWCANHDVLPQLAVMSIPVGTGGVPVFISSANPDIPDILFGRPIIFTEFCKTVGDVGDICLCNCSQYLEGTYQPIQGASSIHVRFVNHEQAFKFWMRNDGRPWWTSALTPKNSAATLSPFVTLAAR